MEVITNNMDNELFELCKEVKKIFPNWVDSNFKFVERKKPVDKLENNRQEDEWYEPEAIYLPEIIDEMRWTGDRFTPLYTSDYLLEKLHIFKVCIFNDTDNKEFQAYVEENDETFNTASTPVKALLKLTLALKEAGEL